ncbi:MAG TPA: ATP-binding protein [Acidimicrobiia bacterium]|jgi:signal transduction histidine kinase/ActR/RegA family two-component response regulator|nr:ATP-binding protein [Acidimicrobiia bacterium]
MTRTHIHSRTSRFTPPALFVVLAVLTIIASLVLHDSVQEQEHRLLHERAGEVGAFLTSSIGTLGSQLGLVGTVYEADGAQGRAFQTIAAEFTANGRGNLAIVATGGGNDVVRAAAGKGLTTGGTVTGTRAALVERATKAKGFVSVIIPGATGNDRGLAFAQAIPGGLVVYSESTIGPVKVTESSPSSPFNELEGAIYTGTKPVASQILSTTTTHLPMKGAVDSRTVTVGADKWLVVLTSREPLVGSLALAVPWIVLTLGLFGSVIVALVIALMMRRRAYALHLVAERTAVLEQTMAELEIARTSAEAANDSKSEFLSRMSHELRTPLNAVLGFAQLLEIEPLSEEQRESVTQIVKGGRHLLQLINEVLDISRIETGNLALSAEPVLPTDVVSDVLDLIRPLAVERSVTITANLGAADAYVLADRQRLRQVLLNLLSNAVKYNRVGGTIAIGCDRRDPGQIRISVTDTGAGIPLESQSKLFQPFERLGAEQTNVEGTGVGLALSRKLTDAMGGRLDFESTVGRGSTFYVELPLTEGPVERFERMNPEPVEAAARDAARHTVLYIEDNLANVKLIEHVFASRGDIDLVPAMQGRMGLDLARREPPALVLLDLHLTDMDGRDVLQQLRAEPATADLPVIVLSADATERQIERLLAEGATAYVTKPIDLAEFLARVDELLPKTPTIPLIAG